MIQRTLLSFAILLLAFSAWSQPQHLVGNALNSDAVQQFIGGLEEEGVESFLPFQQVYKLSYVKSGLELEFNSDMALYQISLYDSGHTFGTYTGDLPYAAFWGVDSVQLQAEMGIMQPKKGNPFVKYYSSPESYTAFYFRNGKLEHVRITATVNYLKDRAREAISQWGMRLLPDGKAVSGNVLDGEGTMAWGQAATYQGEWSYGLPHGIGVYRDSFGNVYAGEFKLGFFWGPGSYTSATYKYQYDGMYLMGRMHGQGIVDYGGGRTYNGEWSRDRMHGIGQYTMTTDYFYQGEMRNNAFNGQGVLSTPDGYIKGQFKDGRPHGYCEQYAEQSQQTLSGYWQYGKKQGEFNLNAFGYDQKVLFKDDVEVSIDGKPKVLPEQN